MTEALHLKLAKIRKDLGLRQTDVDHATNELGARISQAYLTQIESGKRALGALPAVKVDALRRVYGFSPEAWHELTGLSSTSNTTPDVPENLELLSQWLPEEWIALLNSLPVEGRESRTPGEWLDLYQGLKGFGIDPSNTHT